MSLKYQTTDFARWFFDSAVTTSAAELSALAETLAGAAEPYAALFLDSPIDALPDAAAVTGALQTFGERVALLAPYCSERNAARLLRFSQTVNGALLARLREFMPAGRDSGDAPTPYAIRERNPADGDSTVATLRARVGHLLTIQRVNNLANSTLDLEQVLDLTVQAVNEALQLDDCSIYLFDERLDSLTLRATTGLNPGAVGRVSLRLGEGVTGWAAQYGEPVALENAWEDPRFVHIPDLMEESLSGMLSVPIILYTVNKLIGVLNVQTRLPRQFSSEEIGFVETVCGQVAIAIDNARLYEQTDEKLREKVSQLTTLQRVWASIASSLDLNQVLDMIVRHAAELSSADKAAIFQVDEQEQNLMIVAGYNLSEQYMTMRVAVGEGTVGRSVAERTPVRVEDALDDPVLAAVYPQIAAEGIRSMFCVPLLFQDRVLGGISVYTRERHEFSEEQIQLVSTFAHDAALAIENARLYQEAQRALKAQAVLMRELNHRVKNNLQTVASLLSLQMRRAESAEAAELLGLSATRVESIAAVHELLSDEDIGSATVEEIARRIMEIEVNDMAPPSQRIEFAIAPAPIKLGSKRATLFALVLNELVSNSVTHGLAGQADGHIRMTATQENGSITVDVWDSGKGLPPGFSLKRHAGLGLSIIEQLVTHELSGAFQIEDAPNGGTKARVTFRA